MTDSQTPLTFSEDDEQLYQAARAQLLGVAPVETIAEPAKVPDPQEEVRQAVGQRRLRNLVIVLVVLAAFGTLLGWVLPDSFGDFKLFGVVVLAVIGAALLIARAKTKWAARKVSPSVTAAVKPPKPWVTFVLTFVFFLLLGVAAFTPVELAWLTGTLVLHEAGHFLGMRYFGYKDVQMFFIPLFGAAVRGEKTDVPAWQEAIVLLLGPLPGLVLGCGLYFADLAFSLPALRVGASWLVTINFLNLMPLGPLDGGKLWNRLLFSRFALLESLIVVPASLGLVLLCFGPEWICLGLTGFAALAMVPVFYKTATAAAVLQARWPDLPADIKLAGDEQLRVLFQETRQRFPVKKLAAKDQGDPKKRQQAIGALVAQMKNIYQRALQRPAPGPVALGFFALYAAAILLTIATASATALGTDAGRFPLRMKQRMKQSIDLGPAPEQDQKTDR